MRIHSSTLPIVLLCSALGTIDLCAQPREAPRLEKRGVTMQLIVDGKSNKEIAAQLDLSVNTVAVHRANIMDALGIHKTAELVVYAIRNGLVNIP